MSFSFTPYPLCSYDSKDICARQNAFVLTNNLSNEKFPKKDNDYPKHILAVLKSDFRHFQHKLNSESKFQKSPKKKNLKNNNERSDVLCDIGGRNNGNGGFFFKFTSEFNEWTNRPWKLIFLIFFKDDIVNAAEEKAVMVSDTNRFCEDIRFEDTNGDKINHGDDLLDCLPLKKRKQFNHLDIEASAKLLLMISPYFSVRVVLENISTNNVIVTFQMNASPPPSSLPTLPPQPPKTFTNLFPRELIFMDSSQLETNSDSFHFDALGLEFKNGFQNSNPSPNRNLNQTQSSNQIPNQIQNQSQIENPNQNPNPNQNLDQTQSQNQSQIRNQKIQIDFQSDNVEQFSNFDFKMGSFLYISRFHLELSDWLKEKTWMTPSVLKEFKNEIEKKYKNDGYLFANIKRIRFLNDGKIVTEIDEGLINKLEINFVNKSRNKIEGKTKEFVIMNEIPSGLSPGRPYNALAAKKSVSNLMSLQLFEDVKIFPVRVSNPAGKPAEKDKILVKVEITESSPKRLEMDLTWNLDDFFKNGSILPTLFPGGSIFLENKNWFGPNQSLFSSVSTSNFWHPWDDLGFKTEYNVPWISKGKRERKGEGRGGRGRDRGEGREKAWEAFFRRSLSFKIFNSRKLSPVFWCFLPFDLDPTSTLGSELKNLNSNSISEVWVDRSGCKMDFSNRSRSSPSFLNFGFVLENVKTRDESGHVISHVRGNWQEVKEERNAFHPNGLNPRFATSHSETGSDFLSFLQVNITRDKTKYSKVHNSLLGCRSIIQIDQSLGNFPPLQRFPLFNRQIITHTHFSDLTPISKFVSFLPTKKFPPVLVLHSKCANSLGQIPAYDLFLLGGPHSVRGYDLGEIASCTKFLELSMELRVPISKTCVYSFWECASDLGSSVSFGHKFVQLFDKPGCGASLGLGVQFCNLRFELVRETNSGLVSSHVRFGERY